MTEMSPAETVFFAALAKVDPAERAAYLNEACGADTDLRRCVDRLLAAHPQVGSFLRDDDVAPTSSPGGSWARDEWRRHRRAADHRAPRHGDRPVQAPAADRRGRHGHRLHGRADPARAAQGRPQGHQARHGQPPGHRPLRGRAAGPGHDGPCQHRPRPRRRRHGIRPALLRHGAGPRRADHQVLRRQPPDAARAAGAVRAGLPGDPARPPEGRSFTATSSRPTSWSRSTTASRCPR